MKHFGTDGIRGIAGEFLSPELAFRVGASLAVLEGKSLVIGRDTRESGIWLSERVMSGARSVGLDVMDLGIVSTPMLSHLSGRTASLGVMITASHNPYRDNGIKVFREGKKLFASEEGAIEDVLNGIVPLPVAKTAGKVLPPIDAFGMYSALYEGLLVPSGLSIALDLANGSDHEIGPRVFSRIASRLSLTGIAPNGKNINDGVGSTHLENLIRTVTETGSDLGFAVDGDGDRLLAVDAEGRIFDGDLLLYVIACFLRKKDLLNQNAVVLTKMSNLGIIKAFVRAGIRVELADVGDKYVLEALETHDYTLGGENSGHLINRLLLNTGDGLLNAAFLVRILAESGKTLADLTAGITLYPDRLVNLRDVDKTLVNRPEILSLVDSWRNRLGDDGKIIVRASGTEPLIRVSVSAKTEELLVQCQNEIVGLLKNLSQK